MTVGLNIELEEVEQKVILRIEGRLDAPSSPTLEKKLLTLIKEEHLTLLLDFSRVEYLSSAGMRLLLSFTKQLTAKGGKLVIFSVHDEVMEIIKLAGFDRILKICKSEQNALQL